MFNEFEGIQKLIMSNVKSNNSIYENYTSINVYGYESVWFTIIQKFLIIVFLVSLLLNVILIVSIILTKRRFQPVKILVLNLAVADLVHTMSMPPFIYQSTDEDYIPTLASCRLFFLSDFVTMGVSAFTVAALSIERFRQIFYYKTRVDTVSNKFKTFITFIYLFLIWSLTLAFALPFTLSLSQNPSSEEVTCDSNWNEISINLFFGLEFVFIFLLPYTLIIIASLKLIRFLRNWFKKHNKNLKGLICFSQATQIPLIEMLNSKTVSTSVEAGNLVSNKRRVQTTTSKRVKIQRISTRIVIMIVFCYLVQWMPIWLLEIMFALKLDHDEYHLKYLVFVFTSLAYTNSVSNPIVYMLSMYNLKAMFSKIFNKNSVDL